MIKKRRTAKFYVEEDVYLEDRELIQKIYSRCIPYRVEYLYHCRSFEVYAESPEFFTTQEGMEVHSIIWYVDDLGELYWR